MDTEASGNTTPSAIKSRAYQLTLNQTDKFEGLINEFRKLKSCDYRIACLEKAPTTGHEHIHLYVHFNNPYKLSKKIMSFGAHVEICKGSPKQNIDYIEKDGNVILEEGERPRQGCCSVKDLKEITNPDDLNWNQYNTWKNIKATPKKTKLSEWKKDVKIYFIYGPSGIGKTDKSEEILRSENVDEFEEVKHVGEFWHGVVDGQGACIYDDFRDSHMTASEFINFIDYRSHNLNVKGGSVKNNYNLIIITSVQDPYMIYKNIDDEPRKQWIRRMNIVNLMV